MGVASASLPRCTGCFHWGKGRRNNGPEAPRELSQNPREEESDPSASAIAQDTTFYAAMRRAIEKGLERAPIGIDRRPGTKRPIFILGWLVGAQAPYNAGTGPSPAPTKTPQARKPGPKFRWSCSACRGSSLSDQCM